ncbi:MAG: aldo/keto reductase [Thermomicrobiales bacterium]
MKYTTLGRTGLIVSRLAFGTMTFGAAYGAIAKVDQESATALVARALDAGVTFFDTADQYSGGQAEELLGKALGPRRGAVVVATKVGLRMDDTPTSAGLSAHHIIASAEASLRRLDTDYIDLYQLHLPDPLTSFDETARALDDLVRRGLVRYVGFCNFAAWQAATMLGLQRAHGYAPFVSAQMYYSLLGRDIEHDMAPLARHAGLAILPWSPLAGGFLSGKYVRDTAGGGSEGRRAELDFPPVDRDLGYDVVDTLRAIATAHGTTPARVALAWMLARPGITSVIIGASKATQLDDNLGAIDLVLAPEQIATLDAMTAPAERYPNWMATRFPDTTTIRALSPEGSATVLPQ